MSQKVKLTTMDGETVEVDVDIACKSTSTSTVSPSIVVNFTMDGETVEVDVDIACKSILVKGIIDDSGVDDEIPLPQIKRSILDKIIEYCTYIHSNQPPEIEKPLRSA